MAVLMRRALIGMAAFAIAGCGLVRDPVAVDVDGSIQVHSLLVAGAPMAAVLITRVDPNGSSASFDVPARPVENASVMLIRGGDTLTLVGGAAGGEACVATGFGSPDDPADFATGCYAGPVPDGIEAGATYELRVVLPSGGEVEGSVVVPEPPHLITPEPGTMLGDPFHVRWAGLPDRRIDIHVDPHPDGCRAWLNTREGFGATASLAFIDVDSAAVRVAFLECDEPTDTPFPADVVLTVYDAPFSHYMTLGSGSIGVENASVGITGAYGVFAGAAQDRVEVTLAAQDSP